mmetsp:Transcript_41478/g.98282  ORF Transcript_41478/g.98282 Transcript_41478/m.98282 type:complete len:245 (-) Transcript_41478:618-1352(-)
MAGLSDIAEDTTIFATMRLARTRRRSLMVLSSSKPYKISSAALPARVVSSCSSKYRRVNCWLSSRASFTLTTVCPSGYFSRGMMLTLTTGSIVGISVQVIDVAASWTAILLRRSTSCVSRVGPRRSRSSALRRSLWETESRSSRPASIAAVLTRFASCAPLDPCVSNASSRRSTSSSYERRFMWTCMISMRPLKSGLSTKMMRSNRPGRVSAGSRTSFRLVAAMTMTPSSASNPSISLSIWFSV